MSVPHGQVAWKDEVSIRTRLPKFSDFVDVQMVSPSP